MHTLRAGVPNLKHLALSGCGYGGFHAGANFAMTQFSEVRMYGFLGSLYARFRLASSVVGGRVSGRYFRSAKSDRIYPLFRESSDDFRDQIVYRVADLRFRL
jgi:hypothetical protein